MAGIPSFNRHQQARLVDYVAIFGIDCDELLNGKIREPQQINKGKLLQRFPEKDWPNNPFIDNIDLFCQPLGWHIKTNVQDTVPKFFQFVLTDIDAARHYCSCLTFYENVLTQSSTSLTASQQQTILASQNNSSNKRNGSLFFFPKSIVLISKFNYQEAFKNCLSIFYSVHVNNLRYSLETIVGNLLANVKVPPCGRQSIRFSLSAGDCLTIQPPLTDTIPPTSTSVYKLVENLGINNVIQLFYAVLTESKILFYSQTYARLNDACSGLLALMYPFKYNHIYIPILPAGLIEILTTPIPFVIGVHSSVRKEISDLLDVIVVDLDGGSIKVPDSLRILHLDDPYHSQLTTLLIQIFQPQILNADDAFPTSNQVTQPSTPELMDKEIRATFLRTLTQLLQGYRSCLSVIRIHPKTLISFHKATFLGQRGFVDNEFMTRLLDCMFFEKFVEARGLPFRHCDLFDNLHAIFHEKLLKEKEDSKATTRNIKTIAQDIYECENPALRTTHQKTLKPIEEYCKLPLKNPFPRLDSVKVGKILSAQDKPSNSSSQASECSYASSEISSIDSATINTNNEDKSNEYQSLTSNISSNELSFVPSGLTAERVRLEFNAHECVINSARRLEVMRNCVNCIFDNRIPDARKALPAVLKALKNKSNRLALIDELACHAGSQRAVLEHQQFDLVVRLMNCALQHETHIDLNNVAAKILPLAMEFCRRLCTNYMQFAYTCIQDHPVWSNPQFWESAFYMDVEKDIIGLYKPIVGSTTSLDRTVVDNTNKTRSSNSTSPEPSPRTINGLKDGELKITDKDSGLDVAAKKLKFLSKLSESQRDEIIKRCSNDEDATIFGQAMHYTNRIIFLKVPLDISTRSTKQSNGGNNDQSLGAASSQLTHSIEESERNSISDEESGFGDEMNGYNIGNSEIATSVVKFVTRFVDKVCTDSGISEERLNQLHMMIPQAVAMHIESLDSIYRESKRIPPVSKPKIMNPDLIETEVILMPGLRTYLLPDGREKDNVKDESIASSIGGPVYLPAEGAIFITNYRVIFKGRPCDPFYCEQTIVRSFPVATLTKEKRITIYDVPAVDQVLKDGLQLRSNTFQLIRIAFDEEVSSDSIEIFRKHLSRLRSQPNKLQLFAFTSNQSNSNNSTLVMQSKSKTNKSATLKSFAKRTYMKTAQKVGFKKKEPNKNRLPAIVWEHARTGAVMLRSGGFQSKGVFDTIKKPGQILYIMTEKAQIKSVKPEMLKSCEFIPLDLHEVRQVKNNFAKFLRACVPSAPVSLNEASLAKQLESTEWFAQLKNILDSSNKMVQLLDKEGKSVLLSIEDNWEITPQITSIALLCLDPFYRTYEGFKALIEKEWLEFGHKFSYKSNYTGGSIASNFTLMFLQFLDLVHHIHRQYSLSFEFNQYYLKFLAYHQVSCRFSTFLFNLDQQANRNETDNTKKSNDDSSSMFHTSSTNSFAGVKSSNSSSSSSEISDAIPDSGRIESPSKSSTSSRSNNSDSKTLKPIQLNLMGRSFWEYADRLWNKSPTFFNYYYTPVNVLDTTRAEVLIPNSSIQLFKLWDYFTSEELLHGPSYDSEVFHMARQHREEILASGDQANATKRRQVLTNYDCINLTQCDGLTQLMADIKGIEADYNLNTSRWTQVWSHVENSIPVE